MIFVPKLHKVHFEISTDFMRLNKKKESYLTHAKETIYIFPNALNYHVSVQKETVVNPAEFFGESKCLVPALPRNPDLSLQDLNEIVQICDKVLECFLESNLSVFNI